MFALFSCWPATWVHGGPLADTMFASLILATTTATTVFLFHGKLVHIKQQQQIERWMNAHQATLLG